MYLLSDYYKLLRDNFSEHPIVENRSYIFTEYPDKEDKPVQKVSILFILITI